MVIEKIFPYKYTVIDKIYDNVVDIENAQPYFIYKEISLTPGIEVFHFGEKVNQGFIYLLRKANIISGTYFINDEIKMPESDIYMEFFDVEPQRAKQISPIPARLFGSPVGNSEINSKIDFSGKIVFTAVPYKYSSVLNYVYRHGNDLHGAITLKNRNIQNGGFIPVCQIMLEGYLIPEKTLAQWN